jgi:hypothetical protein
LLEGVAAGAAVGVAATGGGGAVEGEEVVVDRSSDGCSVLSTTKDAREGGRESGEFRGVLKVVEEDGVEVSSNDGGDAWLENRLDDGAKDGMKALRRDGLDRLARLDEEDSDTFVAKLRGEEDGSTGEELGDGLIHLLSGERGKDGAHKVEEEGVTGFGGEEVERLGENDIEEVTPRLESVVPRESDLATVVLHDEGLDDCAGFELRRFLLRRRVEESSVLQLPPSGVEECEEGAKVVHLAPGVVLLEARLKPQLAEEVKTVLVRGDRVVPSEVERVEDLEHPRKSLLESRAALLEERRYVVGNRSRVVEESSDEFSSSTVVVPSGEHIELEGCRVEEPGFGLKDGANGGSRCNDLIPVGVLDAAESAL